MTKELIISANVHEKKVAILEDGLVTEFYVERSDDNQGVVGNLYKGRVMKVLPGMQSAFVDIGLERDAFLYVSDFAELMEEEDAVEIKETPEDARKAKGRAPGFDRGFPARPAARPPYGRPDSSLGEPLSPAADDRRMIPIEDAVEQLAEITDESLIPPPAGEDEIEAELALGSDYEPPPPAEAATEFIGESFEGMNLIEPAYPERELLASELVESEDAAEVTDAAVTKGRQPRKPSRPRSTPVRRGSRRRAGFREEPEIEPPQAAPGLPPVEAAPEYDSRFERVMDDENSQDAGEMLKDALVQERIYERTQASEFEVASVPPEPEPETRVGSLRSRFKSDTSFHRVSDADEEIAGGGELGAGGAEPAERSGAAEDTHSEVRLSRQENAEAETGGGAELTGEANSGSPFRHISDFIQKRFYQRSTEEKSGGGPKSADSDQIIDAGAGGIGDETASSEELEQQDGEASVRTKSPRAEFAARRGGRGRRRRRETPPEGDEEKPQAEGGPADAESVGDEEVYSAGPEPDVDAAPAGASAPVTGPASAPADAPPNRRPGSRRLPPPPRRNEYTGPPRATRRPERGVATISDLLREGQEILVQIAKEPIAKKGARITSHIALPGRYMVYMPTVNHVGVSRKIASEVERIRLKRIVTTQREREGAGGGFIARTACEGHTEEELIDDMRYLLRTWADIKKKADQVKAPSLTHRDLDLVQRILRDHLSDDFSAIRVDNEIEYARLVEFVNRINPKLVRRVKLYTGDQPILEKYAVQSEIDKAVKPRVWLKSGGHIVINQTEALVAIDVNTGKFVGKSDRLEDTITRTNLDAVKEIVRQVRLRDLGGIIVIDFIDMEERKNRQRVMMALQQELHADRAPSKILSINDFGLVAITRKRVKQSLERTLCTPCPYCQGAGMVKSPQTMCFEILEQAKAMSRQLRGTGDVTLRVSPEVADAFRAREREVLDEIEAYFNCSVTIEADPAVHREQFDFAIN